MSERRGRPTKDAAAAKKASREKGQQLMPGAHAPLLLVPPGKKRKAAGGENHVAARPRTRSARSAGAQEQSQQRSAALASRRRDVAPAAPAQRQTSLSTDHGPALAAASQRADALRQLPGFADGNPEPAAASAAASATVPATAAQTAAPAADAASQQPRAATGGAEKIDQRIGAGKGSAELPSQVAAAIAAVQAAVKAGKHGNPALGLLPGGWLCPPCLGPEGGQPDRDEYQKPAVRFFVPEDQFEPRQMPDCPGCHKPFSGIKAWTTRRVVDMKSTYYLVGKRYSCKTCTADKKQNSYIVWEPSVLERMRAVTPDVSCPSAASTCLFVIDKPLAFLSRVGQWLH